MESSFGHDFSSVRVHEGASASAIGATAYTQGSDVSLSPASYQPTAIGGGGLIGHEAAHVVQQRAGLYAGQY